MSTISLCMIVKNERKGALKAIKNLDPFIDEMIVVDTGSTDGTPEALEKAGCKVYHQEWHDNFSDPRNESLRHATSDWILVLDADEKYDLESLKMIKNFADNGPQNVGYIATQRHYVLNAYLTNYFKCDGKYALEEIGYPGYYQSCVCRLFPRHPQIYFTGRIHEIVEPQMQKIGFDAIMSDIVIHHYGNVEHKRKRLKKAETYIRLLKLKAEEAPPDDWKTYYDIGLEYLTADVNDPVESEKYFTKSLEVLETETCLVNRALLYMKIQKPELALKDFRRALELHPGSDIAKGWIQQLEKQGVK
jgi:glycosyltransferase involved in cell wall biosynthesis